MHIQLESSIFILGAFLFFLGLLLSYLYGKVAVLVLF
uniref:Uncharacterized protein n=1 Tax=Anguilla anguilla TaxID=7936 RepID=A0A0E9RIX8_ANGAN